GIFAIPEYLNKEVVSLLCHTLQVDPVKRATMKEIREHEWFKKDLPSYLFPSSSDHDASIINTEIVKEICEKFNVDEREVHKALLADNPHDQLYIAYHLIMDNMIMHEEMKNTSHTLDPTTENKTVHAKKAKWHLDFKSLNAGQDPGDTTSPGGSSSPPSSGSQLSIEDRMETDEAGALGQPHHTLEFFEMCASLICALAR
ncbi:non-specific serine/threonine protein kinase, partial [Elysia marginata]